ncbi:ribulose-phosphate 3-epimerase [Actinomycetaceae bacterium TAE3-ERU4]|nr:ribulose-phosphate 3-epimerase [Actinomycetaceae bacterium TAE3-ERU4]
MVLIAPSILNSDASNLAGELERISNADLAHVDVMDNHFVPNLTWGLPVVEALVKRKILPLDAHLMIENPERWAPAYAEVGCQSVTFHIEAANDPLRVIKEIKSHGARAAVALKPGTGIEAIEDLLPSLDMVLVMTVEPGFGGQAFMSEMIPKVRTLRSLLNKENLEVAIQVDGGISAKNIELVAEAGANIFVAGSAVFRSDSPSAQVSSLRDLAQGATCC